ncbi:energy transducer TonB [bacterium]|nr:energy transducer TonB [bacterium]
MEIAGVWFKRIAAAALAAAVAGCGAGGSGNSAAQTAAAASPDYAGGARVVTNLDQLSNANTTSSLLANRNLLKAPAPTAATNQQAATNSTLARLYLANPTANIYTGDVKPPPGDTTLLNAKARKYPEFGYTMLRQTLKAAQEIEAARFGQYALPSDIKPVILRLTLNAHGRLTDIAIEQRSGVAKVDQAMIDACKKGMWAMNPPAGARDADGDYHIRFEGLVQNYSYDLGGDYTYATHLGLLLL